MKYSWLFIIFISFNLYAQHKETKDSIAYYDELANSNISINKFKNALFYTQKAIDYAEANNQLEAQATQTLYLGKIYFDLQKYNDAIESLSKSISAREKRFPPF